MTSGSFRLDPAAVRMRLDLLLEVRVLLVGGDPQAPDRIRRLAHGVRRSFELVMFTEVVEAAKRLEEAEDRDLLFRVDELIRVIRPMAGAIPPARGVLTVDEFSKNFSALVTKNHGLRENSSLAFLEHDPAPKGEVDQTPADRRMVPDVLNEALRPSDVLGWDVDHHLLVLFPETPLLLAAGLLRGGIRQLPPLLSFSAGIVPVKTGISLNLAVAKAKGLLDEAGPGGRGRVVTPEGEGTVLKGRVLLAEDDPVYAAAVKDRLLREGFEVIHAGSGTDALRYADEQEFQLVVLDVKMPGLDGFEVLWRLRRHPRFRSTLIIMVTGIGSEYDIAKGLSMDADDYLVKPFSPVELIARIQRLLRKQAGASGEISPPPPPSSS